MNNLANFNVVELSMSECALISGGTNNDELRGDAALIMWGTLMGGTGAVVGGLVGYEMSGIGGAVLGTGVGFFSGAVGIPFAILGGIAAVAMTYDALGWVHLTAE